MKIARLRARKVHGYLPLDVKFSDDVTFLIGLNGSGKTSALRLLMALLTPNIDELGSISFSEAAVTIHDGTNEIVVTAKKTIDNVTLSVSSMSEVLTISSADLELYMDVRRREESRSPILEKYQQHPVFQRIRSISTPMFLGLDRRFYAPEAVGEDIAEIRKQEYLARRYWPEEGLQRGAVTAALFGVNYLVVTRMQEIRASLERLDERLRTEFFTKAFEYKPSDIIGAPARLPSRAELEKYRRQLSKIEQAAEGVKIPVPKIREALVQFFERMSVVIESLDRSTKPKRASKKPDKVASARATSGPTVMDRNYFEWLVNGPQADRILEHLELLEEYVENRTALREPVNRFLSLVNGFFDQTKKQVSVQDSGQLIVSIKGYKTPRSISALSSGERQLLIMLAHLTLNPNLVGSGIFIVDEPELSLHIDWQEKFVDAVRQANPDVQLILATHSPAIILDRTESCRDLSETANA